MAGAALLGWMDPRRADLLSLVSGAAQSLADAGPAGVTWTAPSSGQRAAMGTGAGGEPCFIMSNAANTRLDTTSGGVTGAASHSIWWLAEIITPTAIGGLGGLGQIQSGNSIIGTWTSSRWWGGGAGLAAPLAAGADTAIHTFSKDFDGSGLRLWVDGIPPAIADGLPVATATAWSPTLVAGSGIFAHAAGFASDAKIYQGAFFTGVAGRGPGSLAWLMDDFMCRIVPRARKPRRVVCVGDSFTLGNSLGGSQATGCYPAQMQAYLLSNYGITASYRNAGQSGWRTDQILADLPTMVYPWFSACDESRDASIMGGLNDLSQASGTLADTTAIAAGIYANLVAIIAAARAAGALRRVVLATLPSFSIVDNSSTRTAWRLALNVLIRATPDVRIADIAARSEFSDYTNATWYDQVTQHPTAAGYALIGQIIAAASAAA